MDELLYGLLGLLGLFIPGLVARARKHHNTNSIFLLSLAGLGVAMVSIPFGAALWGGALIWAFTNPAPIKNQ